MRVLQAVVILSLYTSPLFPQEQDYRKIFGKDWDKAAEFINENQPWMKKLSARFNVPYPVAVAVVFPELIRYSALRDRMEITVLKSLYIYAGEDYADFSVGRFQMKPSFAEAVNERSHLLKGRLRNFFPDPAAYNTAWRYRSSIVARLENPRAQFIYLIAFIRICGKTFDLGSMDEEEKVKFLSAAYNYSFLKSFEEVNLMAGRKFFSTKLVASEYYCYSDISLAWFRSFNR